MLRIKLLLMQSALLISACTNDFDTLESIRPSVALFGGSYCTRQDASIAIKRWEEQCNCSITNYGVSGAGFSQLTQDENIPFQVDKMLASNQQFDFVIFWASSNDFEKASNYCGTADDYTEVDDWDAVSLETQCGGINYCLNKLKEYSPNTIVIFLTSLPVFNRGERGYSKAYSMIDGMQNFVVKQIDCCKNNKVLYFDQFNVVSFNIDNYSLYYENDRRHLNRNGYEYISGLQSDFLHSIIKF